MTNEPISNNQMDEIQENNVSPNVDDFDDEIPF